MAEDHDLLVRFEQPGDVGGMHGHAIGCGVAGAAVAAQIGRKPTSRPARLDNGPQALPHRGVGAETVQQ